MPTLLQILMLSVLTGGTFDTATETFEYDGEVDTGARLSTEHLAYLKNRSPDDPVGACPSSRYPQSLNRFEGYSCWRENDGDHFILPPFPPAIPRSPTLDPTLDDLADLLWAMLSIGHDFAGLGWATADTVQDGALTANDWIRLASSSATFGCYRGECLRIVSLRTDNSPRPTTLALCKVVQLDQGPGPPEGCFPILQRDGEVLWLRIWWADIASGGGGRSDFEWEIIFPYGHGAAGLTKRLSRLLTESPWALEVRADGVMIIATSNRRVSQILDGWREYLTVRIDATTSQITKIERRTALEISTTIYVNRLNTAAAKDWHLPTEEQQSRYVEEIKKLVRSGIRDACKTYVWEDSDTVVCEGR